MLRVELAHRARDLLVARQGAAQRDQPVREVASGRGRRPRRVQPAALGEQGVALAPLAGDERRIAAALRGGPGLELLVDARDGLVDLDAAERGRLGTAGVGERSLPAPDDVDAADPLELVGGRRPGTRCPTGSARAIPWPTWRPSTTRSAPASRASRRASRLVDWRPAPRPAPRPCRSARDLAFARPRSDPRRCRRASPPAPGRRRRTRRPGRRRRSSSSDGATRGRRRQVDRQPRRDDVGRAAAHVGLGEPRRERPELDQLRRQEARAHARRSPADFLAAALRERQPAPVEHQHRAAARGGLAHQRRVARDVAQRIAGAAARLERPVDLGRVEDRQAPLGGPRRGGPRRGIRRRGPSPPSGPTAGSRAANGARMGSTMAIPRRRWQFPGCRGRRA